MNQQEKTFTINVFPCKCATSLITKRKRDKNPFINYKIIPILLKQTQQKILLIRERERKKKIFIITGKSSNQNGEKISNVLRNF